MNPNPKPKSFIDAFTEAMFFLISIGFTGFCVGALWLGKYLLVAVLYLIGPALIIDSQQTGNMEHQIWGCVLIAFSILVTYITIQIRRGNL